MKRMLSNVLLIVLIAAAAACGESEQPDGPTRVEQDDSAKAQLAEARARIDRFFFDAEHFDCLCEASADGVEPADVCPDDNAEPAPDVATDTACVLTRIEADPPPEGDLSPYASCVDNAVSAFESCLEDPDLQTCTDDAATDRDACFQAAQQQGRSCDDDHASFAAWFETIDEDVVAECGLEQ
ncbi:hypothetical protein DL240_16290 [Lujinxingia litoralis]|uniref:Secreted protein n=1 Tax=Lujinxingia litoralis TaxID=2211119 RepID=A0A328C6H5_9DELT|nr:hypothetical protein [Lujinxingia litoralis]RAL20591.1 hypothetical protein DL240_16290 [Lujinxingia litoralis]